MNKLQGLKVYEKALTLAAQAEDFSAPWGKRNAIVDQFRRATESIVLNIAEGVRVISGSDKAKSLDYAIGSTLECAACLDIARIKGGLKDEELRREKIRVLEITRMLIGLRKSWLQNIMSESPLPYQTQAETSTNQNLFHHESLDVYRTGLDFMRWFVEVPGARELTDRHCREIDRSATSIILNIAEGNGRYSELDHRRFLQISAASAMKAVAYLDLYQQKSLPIPMETSQGNELLFRILAMLENF